MAEVELPPDHGVDIDGYAAVVEVQRVLKHLEQGPHGDLACNAERAAFLAVYTLR